jgi:hypothetical protein
MEEKKKKNHWKMGKQMLAGHPVWVRRDALGAWLAMWNHSTNPLDQPRIMSQTCHLQSDAENQVKDFFEEVRHADDRRPEEVASRPAQGRQVKRPRGV